MVDDIRVRIAPSPTGNLHVGTARVALFNWLFAKNNNGKFILRIEDTDLTRSKEEYVINIFNSLKALGLDWDECYRQSERNHIYLDYANNLINLGYAYYSDNAIKFKMPSGEIKFIDLIKGEIKFDINLIDDFIIIKSDGTPTYNFAVVVDDIDMNISHVIRGEDHIPNTPKQIAIYKALNIKCPKFAHLGMILASDGTKISKRHGATAVDEYMKKGYLPEAFINFIALLGWYPKDGKEIKSLEELKNQFNLNNVCSHSSIFEFTKLDWMNGYYIRNLDIDYIFNLIRKDIKNISNYREDILKNIVDKARNKVNNLNDIIPIMDYYLNEDFKIDDKLKSSLNKEILNYLLEFLKQDDFKNIDSIDDMINGLKNTFGNLKTREILYPIRVALTGKDSGIDLNIIFLSLGYYEVINRFKNSMRDD